MLMTVWRLVTKRVVQYVYNICSEKRLTSELKRVSTDAEQEGLVFSWKYSSS